MHHTNWRDCQEWRSIGLPMSTTSNEAAKLYDAALTQILSYRDEPSVGGLTATLDKLVAADPEWVLGQAVKIGMGVMYVERLLGSDPTLQADLDMLMELCKRPGVQEWEKMHAEAVVHWAKGYKSKSCATYEEILLKHPRDAYSVQSAHFGYLYLGDKVHHRDLVGKVLINWDKQMPHYGYLLGIHSFGLVDSYSLPEAEDYARQALDLNRFDSEASHTIAHVFDHSGRPAEGVKFMRDTESDWTVGSGLARHNYWHLALLHLASGDNEGALAVYDNEVHTRLRKNLTYGLIDNASLLTRLELHGVKVGDRWQDLYEVGQQIAGQHVITASDVSILTSYLGAGKLSDARKFLESVKQFLCDGEGDNHAFMKAYGHDLLQSFLAYGEGDYGRAVDLLYPIRHEAGHMGGSTLQSDILNLYLVDAGCRSTEPRHHKIAKCLVSERRFSSEECPLTQKLIQRVLDCHDD